MTERTDLHSDVKSEKLYPEPIRSVIDALSQLRFGAIQLTVHEGRLVQIDVTERKRFSN
jgi:hypothetical protein